MGGRATDGGNGSGGLNAELLGGASGVGVGITGADVMGDAVGTAAGAGLTPCGRTVLGLTQSRKSATGAVLHPLTKSNRLAIAHFMRGTI
jgi:hypothetical protein